MRFYESKILDIPFCFWSQNSMPLPFALLLISWLFFKNRIFPLHLRQIFKFLVTFGCQHLNCQPWSSSCCCCYIWSQCWRYRENLRQIPRLKVSVTEIFFEGVMTKNPVTNPQNGSSSSSSCTYRHTVVDVNRAIAYCTCTLLQLKFKMSKGCQLPY